jgi:hypothetical protein
MRVVTGGTMIYGVLVYDYNQRNRKLKGVSLRISAKFGATKIAAAL